MLSYIIKNGSWVFAGNVLLAVFAFLTTTTLAHLLPKETFGTYRFLLAIIPLLAVFTLPDMGPAITRAVAKKMSLNIWDAIREKFCFGLLGSLIAFSMAAFYLFRDNNELATLFAIVAIFIPLFDVFLLYINALYGRKEFKLATTYQVTSKLASMVTIITVALVTSNLVWILCTYFIAQLIPQIFVFFKVASTHFAEPAKTEASILKYGRHLTFIGAVAVLATTIDKLVVWHFFGAEALAIYTVALLVAWEGGRMIESLSVVLLPFLAEAQDSQNIKLLLRHIPSLAIILTVGAIATVFIIPYVFAIIFPNYSEAVGLAQLGCVLLVLLPLNSVLYRYLVAMTLRRRMLFLQSFKITIFLCCFFLLYTQLNLMAVLIALIASELLTLLILLGTTVFHAYRVEV